MANWSIDEEKTKVVSSKRVEDTNPELYAECGKVFAKAQLIKEAEQEYQKAYMYSGGEKKYNTLLGMFYMVSEIIFGLHTGEIERKITRKEMERIKVFFNLTSKEALCNTSYFYKEGINQLEIEEKVKYYNEQRIGQYTLKLRS